MSSLQDWIDQLLDDLSSLCRSRQRRQRNRRELSPLVESTEVLAARTVDPNSPLVALEGHARITKTIEAPLSREAVIGYRLQVMGPGREHAYPPVHIDITRVEDFEVVDETSSVLVRGDRSVLLGTPRSAPELLFDPNNQILQRLIKQAGYTFNDLLGAGKLSCIERVLLPHSQVYVCGKPEAVVGVGTGTSGYREPPARVALGAPEGRRLIIADCHLKSLLTTLETRGIE
jgi:hypothetical protein